jgi:probable blue pigment (indigoidine) exporter
VTETAAKTAWLAARPLYANGFIVLTATTFALGSTVIRFAYDAGAGTLTIVMVRNTISVVALFLLIRALKVPLRFERRELWAAPLIGAVMAGYSGAYYMAITTMPVVLAVLTFYTYPLMTGVFLWLTGEEKFGASGFAALILAFIGLVLALDVSGSSFDLAGTLWALWGAVGFSAVLILSAHLLPKRTDTRPRTLLMLGTASVVAILTVAVSGEVWFPKTSVGWSGLIGSSLCYAAAMTSVLFAASALGATRVALVMNVEPVASLVLTYFILGERLGPFQLFGVALVVASIFLFRPRREPAAVASPAAQSPR